MCGRYYINSRDVRPSETAPVLVRNGNGPGRDGQVHIEWMRWGFPSATGKNLIINARAEIPGVTVSEEILGELLTELQGKVTENDIVVISGSMPKGAPQDTYIPGQKHSGKEAIELVRN